MTSAAEIEAQSDAAASTILGRDLSWSLHGFIPVQTLQDAFTAANFTPPAQTSPVTAAERAVQWGRTSKITPPIVRRLNRGEAAWALITEERDAAAPESKLRLEHVETIRLDPEQDTLLLPDPEYQAIQDRYVHYRTHILASDVSDAVKKIVARDCRGQPLWHDGNRHFVPRDYCEQALRLRTLLRDLFPPPDSVVMANAIIDEPAIRGDTVQQVMSSLGQELKDAYTELQQLVEADDTRASTLLRRLENYRTLRAKLTTYCQTFQVGAAQFERAIDHMDTLARHAVDNRAKVA